MASRAAVAAKVAARKRQHPHLYCPRCLWMTGGGACPRHGGEPWSKERQVAALKASHEAASEALEVACAD